MAERLVVAVPARYGSSRLPGKPLLPICGKPMIVHVVERALALTGVEVVVATDDPRVVEVVAPLGVGSVLTSIDHPTGSDRLAEVAERLRWADDTIVVNLQGDEPMMPLSCLVAVAEALRLDPDAAAATLATPIESVAEFLDPSCVKVVIDASGRALYFSRAPVPFPRDFWKQQRDQLPAERPWRHLGLYAYRARTLRAFAGMPQGRLEKTESLEQLRLLEHGLTIAVGVAPEAIPAGVDTLEDLERVESVLRASANIQRRVLFVCMGNICRSPLAEAYARQRFAALGLDVEVASAGTISQHEGEPADAGALAIARKEGLDLSSHRARRLRASDFEEFDWILALDDRNLRDIHARTGPGARARVRRLLDFVPAYVHREVPDPYGGSEVVFANSLALIRVGVDGLARQLVTDS